MNLIYLVCLILSIVCLNSQAATYVGSTENKRFNLEKANVSVQLPPKWEHIKGFGVVPLTLLGPMKDGSRPVIGVSQLIKAPILFNSLELKKNEAEYQKGRLSWLNKHQGELQSFIPYHVESLRNGIQAHVIGYSFQLQENRYVEKSYYLQCKNRVFHIKQLMRNPLEGLQTEMDSVVGSFDCD